MKSWLVPAPSLFRVLLCLPLTRARGALFLTVPPLDPRAPSL